MSNIEFPRNYDFYLSKGREALEAGHLSEGLYFLEEAYLKKQETIVNWLIVSTAFELGEFVKALNYMNEEKAFYLESVERFTLYFQALLVVKQFDLARKVLWDTKQRKLFSEEEQHGFDYQLELQEQLHQVERQQMIKEIKKRLEDLPNQTAYEQMVQVKEIAAMSLKQKVQLSQKMLTNPSVTPIVRNFLFEELSRSGVNQEIEIIAVDGSRLKLNPVEIGLPEYSVLERSIAEKMKQELADTDPVLLENLLEELRLEMALLYPIQSAYDDPKGWTASLYSEYLERPLSLHPRIEKIRGILKKAMVVL
ncbi:hypothetical protein NRIC_23800 [Enterococcus florum]|uniref:Hydrolase n=1 Tax=Enterococcus florum TaxID=2480627 RepID=A0A4V0WPN6_9ENTE|nr:hypothetical protein [Enterococcus florum]GCF94489.1 hypothetical protein NRIC_23800 [Enterococcus florum]